MHNLEKAIQNWLRAFQKYRAFDDGSIREMELHLRDHIDDLISEGYSKENAFHKAVEEFGEIPEMAQEEFTNIKVKTTLTTIIRIAMYKNYFKTAFRSLLRNPMTSFINIFGLSLAIGICIATYAFIEFDLKIDRFHKKGKQVYLTTYHVDREGQLERYGPSPAPLGELMRQDHSAIKTVCRVDDAPAIVKHKENVFHESIRFVDSEFLALFTFPLKWGLPSALEDVNSIIISEEMSIKYFGDENPVGRSLKVRFGEDLVKTFQVGGVAKAFPEEHIIDFKFLVNYNNLDFAAPERDPNDWSRNITATFIEVPDPEDLIGINESMSQYIALQNEVEKDWPIQSFELMRLYDLHLSAENLKNGISNDYNSISRNVMPIITAFMLILACLNYVNIAVVTATKRLKEIGLRKVMGANKNLVVLQFLYENILLTFLALLVGLVLAYSLVMPWMSDTSEQLLTLNLLDYNLWMYLVGIVLLTALFSGLYPSFYIANFQVVRIFKGTVQFGKKNLLTKVFLGFQMVVACTGITGAVIFAKNATYQNARSWGYNQQQTIYAEVHDLSAFEQLKNKMLQDPNVMSIAGAQNHLGSNVSKALMRFPKRDYEVDHFATGPEYLETLGIEIKEGRAFQVNQTNDLTKAVVNEKLVANLELDQPIGQVFKLDTIRYEIVGVTKDFHVYSFYSDIKPTLFTVSSEEDYQHLVVQTKAGQEMKAYTSLKAHWFELFPEIPFKGGHQEDIWDWFYKQVDTQERFFNALAFISVLLAGLGLYGLVTLNAQGRIREFSIKKVLGAGIGEISKSLISQYAVLTLVSLVLGAPLSYLMIDAMLNMMYEDPMPMYYWQVGFAAVILILVILGVISTQIRRLAKSNPVEGIKVE